MKVLPFTIPKPTQDALILQVDRGVTFYSSLHSHEEIQISYIVSGEGTLFTGDSVMPYQKGEIIVLGSYQPHVFRSDTQQPTPSHMWSVFFTETSFGDSFFQTEELKSLRRFFTKATNGFIVKRPSKKLVFIFDALMKAKKLDRFIRFMELLQGIQNASYESLSDLPSERRYSDTDASRMRAVMEFTSENFRRKIQLQEVADRAAMTKNAFCKYFKKRTRKSYVAFLNEIRIAEAVRLLTTRSDMSIAEVAENSGFQNLSNFNRIFKLRKNCTPKQYRQNLPL